jgi:hypothetical protein
MQIEISSEDRQVMVRMLNAYLPELRREVARTDSHDLRHELVLRMDLCERILAELDTAGKLSARQ